MKRVLLVGLDPATVDFSDPALPPGMTAEKIHAGAPISQDSALKIAVRPRAGSEHAFATIQSKLARMILRNLSAG